MKARGATLLEVLVVSTVFMVLLLAIWLIYDATVRAERFITLNTDIDRTLMTAVRHVDADLKSSRLVEPSDWASPVPVESLQLQPLNLDASGEPVVTAEGLPDLGDPFTIAFERPELVRNATHRRSLGDFGENGSVKFLRKSKTMLEMAVVIEKEDQKGEKSSRTLTFPFRLFNQ